MDVRQGRRRDVRRRNLLQVCIGFGVAGVFAHDWASRRAVAGNVEPITQPATSDPERFMDRAYAMRDQAVAGGDQGYGAVIVKDGVIVGQAPSRVVVNGDPSAHAEMEAIRDAARRLGDRDLGGCVMYSSSRPCRMCETAAYFANIDRLIHGQGLTDGGPPAYSGC